MFMMHPVLEVFPPGDFALWPVAAVERYGYLPLSGRLDTAEVGTAVMRIADYNDPDPEEDGCTPRPADPVGAFLHGLLTVDTPLAPGGLRVTDTATGAALLPGCCNGLEEWRAWLQVLDGDGQAWFGHDPAPHAERHGGTVRLTADADREDSPVIDLSAAELRRLLTGAERGLADFLQLAADWAVRHLPGHAAGVTAVLARCLDLPGPAAH
ncbi:hypothetical protein [Kitasatospora arboriphila]